jgi:hypothetical protein
MPASIEHKFLTAVRHFNNTLLEKPGYANRTNANHKKLVRLSGEVVTHAQNVARKYHTARKRTNFNYTLSAQSALNMERNRLRELAEIERIIRAAQREHGNHRNVARIVLNKLQGVKKKVMNNYGNNLRKLYAERNRT